MSARIRVLIVDDSAVVRKLVTDALRADPEALRGTDAELAAGFDDADVERCLDLVRRLWREIAGEATERFASETAHRRAARP